MQTTKNRKSSRYIFGVILLKFDNGSFITVV